MGTGASTSTTSALRRIRCGSCRNILALNLPSNSSGDVCVSCPYCNEVSQIKMEPQRNLGGGGSGGGGSSGGPPPNSANQDIINCTDCNRSLISPPNTERFRCPCGKIMYATPSRTTTSSNHNRSRSTRSSSTAEFVRCPRCSVVLSPPPGATRFRCVCNIVLSAPNAARWTCNLCERSSPSSIQACVSCGNPRSERPRTSSNRPDGSEGALDQHV